MLLTAFCAELSLAFLKEVTWLDHAAGAMGQLIFAELSNLDELITLSHSFLLVGQSNPLYWVNRRRFLNNAYFFVLFQIHF